MSAVARNVNNLLVFSWICTTDTQIVEFSEGRGPLSSTEMGNEFNDENLLFCIPVSFKWLIWPKSKVRFWSRDLSSISIVSVVRNRSTSAS